MARQPHPIVVSLANDRFAEGLESFSLQLVNPTGDTIQAATAVATIADDDAILVVGQDKTEDPEVRVFNPLNGDLRTKFNAYDPAFMGGVRVATGDVTGDGVIDIVTGPGEGGGPQVRVWDGATGTWDSSTGTTTPPTRRASFMAFVNTYTGGIHIASGDLNGDGHADLIVGTGGKLNATSLDATVKVISGFDYSELVPEFHPFSDLPGYTGGAYVAAGDVNGDGLADIIVGTTAAPTGNLGTSTAARVRVYDGATGASLLTTNLQPYASFAGGAYVGAGDIDADGLAEIITGAGKNGGPEVKAYKFDTEHGTTAKLMSFLAYDASFTGGVRVSGGDADGDGLSEIITGPGSGLASDLTIRNPHTLAVTRTVAGYSPSSSVGVFVGADGADSRLNVQILNDPSATFTGTWTAETAPAFLRGVQKAAAGTGTAKATWTQTVTPGVHRISATWAADATNGATNATYTIKSGGTVLGTFSVNQQQPPAGLTDAGLPWTSLGSAWAITDSSLTVELTNDANGVVVADAIRIERLHDLPAVIASGGSLSYTENNGEVVVDGGLSLGATATGTLARAKVTISSAYAAGQDVLTFDNQANVTGSFNATTGELTLSGTATVAAYQTALRSVRYLNTSENPSLTARTVSFKVNDGVWDSNTAERTIQLSRLNDAVQLANDVLSTIAEDSGTLQISKDVLFANDSAGPEETDQSLTISFVGAAVGGNVQLSGSNVLFTPYSNYYGPASFAYSAQDNAGSSATADVSFTISEVNDTPLLFADPLPNWVEDGGAFVIPFAALVGNDLPGPAYEGSQQLTITEVSNAIGGNVAIVGSDVVFTPAANYNGLASFNFSVQDNGTTAGMSDFKTVLGGGGFLITPYNDAPVMHSEGAPYLSAINEDQLDSPGTQVSTILGRGEGGASFTFTDADDGDARGIALVGVDTTHGHWAYSTDGVSYFEFYTVSVQNALLLPDTAWLRFIPHANFNGEITEAIRFHGWDQTTGTPFHLVDLTDRGGSTPFSIVSETASVSVASLSDPPKMIGIQPSTTILENEVFGPFGFLVSDPETPVENLSLTATSSYTALVPLNAISFGGSGSSRNITVTPAPQQSGSATITVILTDGDGETATASFTLTVDPGNSPPAAHTQSLSVRSDTARPFTLSGDDGDPDVSQTLTYAITTQPAHGVIESFDSETGAGVYLPDEGYGGPDSFEFTVTDDASLPSGAISSAPAAVSIVVGPAPLLDLLGDQFLNEGETVAFNVTATDPDSSVLTFSMVAGPNGATFDPATREFSWTPTEADGPGMYEVTFRVEDENGAELADQQSVSIHVGEVNVAPRLQVFDANGEELETLALVDEGAELVLTFVPTDADQPANTFTFNLDDAPEGVTIDSTGVLRWTPTEAQGPGSYDVTVRVTDSGESPLSATHTLTINVGPVNQAPTLDPVAGSAIERGVAIIRAVGADADLPANTLTYSLGGNPPDSIYIDSATGIALWSPSESLGGTLVEIPVRVSDGVLQGTQIWSADVEEDNLDPFIANINYASPVFDSYDTARITFSETSEGPEPASYLLQFNLNVSVTDNDTPSQGITFSGEALPGGATLDVEGNFSWRIYPEDAGHTHNVTVKATDASGGSDEYTFRVNVTYNRSGSTPTVAAPVALPKRYQTDHRRAGQSYEPLVFTFADLMAMNTTSRALTPEDLSYSTPEHGTLTFHPENTQTSQPAHFEYVPNAGFSGLDKFTYTINDGVASNEATVVLDVTNREPTAAHDEYHLNTRARLDVSAAAGVLDNDDDLDQDVLSVATNGAGQVEPVLDVQHGTLVLHADGSFEYTPDIGFVGVDSFAYRVNESATGLHAHYPDIDAFGHSDYASYGIVRLNVQALPVPDIDTDSNNNGTINDNDDWQEESSPGRILSVNGDLAQVNLGVHGQIFAEGDWTLSLRSDSDSIKIWDSPTKETLLDLESAEGKFDWDLDEDFPSSVWVEGITPGQAALDLVLTREADGYTDSNSVLLTIIDLDLVLSDDYIVVNDDDDDNNGIPDVLDDVVVGDDDLATAAISLDTGGVGLTGFRLVIEAGNEVAMWSSPNKGLENQVFAGAEYALGPDEEPFLNPVYLEGHQEGPTEVRVLLVAQGGRVIQQKTKPAATFGVHIWWGDDRITNETQTVWVGSQISLKAVVTGLPGTLTPNEDATWTIPGTIVKDYRVAPDHTSAQVIPITQADLGKKTIEQFYWLDGGPPDAPARRKVSVVVPARGKNYIRVTTFDVMRPEVTLTIATDTTRMASDANDGVWVRLGSVNPDISPPGIRITVGPTPGIAPEKFAWVQTVDLLARRMDDQGRYWRSENHGLDGAYPYSDDGTLEDTPGFKLLSSQRYVSYDGTFVSYLMFDPETPQSIRVPLQKVEWSWYAEASSWDGSIDFWHIDDYSDPHPSAQRTTTHPVWDKLVRERQAEWEQED